MAERSKALTFLSWTGVVWVRIPLEKYSFILNFSLPPRSEQVSGAHVNEIKHDYSPVFIGVLTPETITQGFVDILTIYIYVRPNKKYVRFRSPYDLK